MHKTHIFIIYVWLGDSIFCRLEHEPFRSIFYRPPFRVSLTLLFCSPKNVLLRTPKIFEPRLKRCRPFRGLETVRRKKKKNENGSVSSKVSDIQQLKVFNKKKFLFSEMNWNAERLPLKLLLSRVQRYKNFTVVIYEWNP